MFPMLKNLDESYGYKVLLKSVCCLANIIKFETVGLFFSLYHESTQLNNVERTLLPT